MSRSIGLRYSEVLTLIAHHATLAADAAMKNPVARPGRDFDDHIERMTALTEYMTQGPQEDQ